MAGKTPQGRYNFEVTEADIEKARVGDSYQCVVAQAIARTIPDARQITVDVRTIRWSDQDGRHVFLTPYAVAGYVIAFDAGDELHPFRFQVRDAIPSVQRKATSKAAKDVKRARDKKRNERRTQARAERVIANPDATPEQKAVAAARIDEAPARIAEADRAHEDVKAAYRAAGENIAEERVSETTRKAPPVSTKRRAYGHRILRVNQAEGRTHVM